MSKVFKLDDKRLTFLPLKQASEPEDGANWCHKERYWIVHPERGLVFFRSWPKGPRFQSPQCNVNQSLVIRMRNQMYPWADVRYQALVFVPMEHSELA